MDETTLIIIYCLLFCGIPIIIGLFILINRFMKNNTKNERHIVLSQNSDNTDLQDNCGKFERKRQLEKARSDFYIAIKNYESLIANFEYEIFELSTYERVYNINNSFVAYIGVVEFNNKVEAYSSNVEFIDIYSCQILIEELTYNTLFKFNATEFGKNFENAFHDIRVNRFYGLKGKYNYLTAYPIQFFEVDKKLPQLNLLERAKNWEGVPCHFIIVELYDENGTAATVKYLTNDNVYKEAQSFCRQIEKFQIRIDYINKISNKDLVAKLNEMRNNFIEKKKKDKSLIWTLRGHLRYFYISDRTTDFDLQSRGAEILTKYENNEFNNIEWCEFGRFESKWKSEALVFELCKKIYGIDNVIFQYSPSFLGQMSYDVFIISKNTAIEYQGKQHFEPVEFFGGQEHFEKQVIRDKLKKELSAKNKIKLIYIDYKETICEKTIIDKVG